MPRAKKQLIKKIIEEVTGHTYEDQSHPLEILELVCSMAETLTEEQDKSAWAFTSRFFRDSIQRPIFLQNYSGISLEVMKIKFISYLISAPHIFAI